MCIYIYRYVLPIAMVRDDLTTYICSQLTTNDRLVKETEDSDDSLSCVHHGPTFPQAAGGFDEASEASASSKRQ